MPEENAVVAPATPEVDTSAVSIADYRKERTEPETPATAPEPVKTAPVPEAGKPQEKEEEEAATGTKPKGGFQRRIDALTKEKGDLERTVSDLQTRLQAL